MVFFTCNTCNESLKKNQVEKHLFKCRGCESLSCVDCGKDFWGDAYNEHTKCISEEEKYSGKDFKPKANANKGEKKQEAWVEQVQAAIDKAKSNPKLKYVLLKIKDCSNIPRKKGKFENFLKNSMGIYDTTLITESWNLIQAGTEQQKTEPAPEVKPVANGNHKPEKEEENGDDASEQKLNKRERKEERSKKTSKKDKKRKPDEPADEVEEEESDVKKDKKKKKKSKSEEAPVVEEEPTKKKSKKRKHQEEEVVEEPTSKKTKNEEEPNEENTPTGGKFQWEETIMECLRGAGDNELSMKKLKKKVLAEFWSQGGDARLQTEEKVLSKFNKKVSKNSQFKIVKDRVKLVS